MVDNKKSIEIKTALIPNYYKDFHCLAASCQDDCCHGWRIEFDKKDYLALRRKDTSKEFTQRLDMAVRRLRGNEIHDYMYAKFQLNTEKYCPLQDPDGLCSLQKNCGEDALPSVCKIFPRTDRYTQVAHEYSLSLGCEGVLKLLWDLPDGIEFIEESLEKKDRRVYLYSDGTDNLEMWFPPIRSLCIDILQNRKLPLKNRMLLLGMALQNLIQLDWHSPDMESWFNRFVPMSQNAETDFSSLTGDHKLYLIQNISVAQKLAIEGKWARRLLDNIGLTVSFEQQQMLFDFKANRFDLLRKRLEDTFGELDYFYENIMVALIWHLAFPSLDNKEDLWKSYVNLCNLYSFYRFIVAAYCGENATREDIFHILVMVSRTMLHNQKRQVAMRDEFFKNDSATLAHMAILVGE